MSAASINDLPDSAFAYIESGGSKDADGKTVPRSLRHFPIHDEAHVRNALARAPQSPFGDKAMPAIRRACKRFGIKWEAMGEKSKVYASAPAQMLGVELARPGTWHLASGKRTFEPEDLQDASDFFAASGQARIPIGFGHADTRFDGDPAFGWVSNIRYTTDAKGPVLLGDLVDMDDWVAAAAPSRWPNRSIEGFANLEWNGRTYRLALTRLALLGSTPPAMPTLRSLADLREAITAAAEQSADCELIAASAAPEDDAATPPEPEEPADLSEPDTEDPAAEAVVPPSEEKEAGMDPAKIRERLGLNDDVSDDDVMEALAYAGFTPAPETPEPVAASGESQQTVDQRIAAAAARGGVITIDAMQVKQFQDGMLQAAALAARLDKNERDGIITAAVKEGKFPPARREHYERAWEADPAGTRELIASLAAGLVPVMASGYSGDGVDEDAEYLALFGERKRG